MAQWTEEQVVSLSPNEGTTRRGRPLANSSKWEVLATDYQAIWGLCKGSGKNPYKAQVNLQTTTFACSCPVRALPCKHLMGLMLLYAKGSGNFKHLPPPDWIKIPKAAVAVAENTTAAPSIEDLQKAAAAKAKRWEKRLELMESGLSELQLWLEDVIRQGVANMPMQQADFWYSIAAKMVDAKLPRLSSFLKETHQMILQSEDWLEPAVARLGELQLWITTFEQREQLPPVLQEELYSALGKTTKKADILATHPKVKGTWLVLTVVNQLDVEGRDYRKVWLQNLETGKFALILDYSFGGMGYEQQYFSGTVIKAALVYYSSNFAQRAICESYEIVDIDNLPAVGITANFEALLEAYANALNISPWLVNLPVLLTDIVPHYYKEKDQIQLVDATQNSLPIRLLDDTAQWKLLAVSGGNPLTVFGEWDGTAFVPLSVIDAQEGVVLL